MRSNYSRVERQKIVEEYIQSGKSQTVFASEYGIKLENQCHEISAEDIAQILNDDDLFDRKSERKSGLLSIPLQHQNYLPIYSSASI